MTALNITNAILYVLSGTGNTYRVACLFKELLQTFSKEAKIAMIEHASPAEDLKKKTEPSAKSSPKPLIGVFFPAHGFLPPWSMIKFLLMMPLGRGAPAVCAATRGALKFGKVLIPGASGFGTFFAAIVLTLKGYRIKAIFSLDMPANMLNLHSSLKKKKVEAISNLAPKKLNRIVPRIMEGKTVFFTRNNLWEACWTAALFWFVPLFPIFYLLFGRISMAKIMFSNNNCVGCGLCARACPNHAIAMKKRGKKKKPFWTFRCEACFRCMGYCNKKAIEAAHSWAVILFFIFTIPVFTYFLNWLYEIFYVVPFFYGYWGRELLSAVYYFPVLIISYWLFWYLLRLPAVNNIFTFSTLTHYYKRYHEPGTKLKDLMKNSETGNKG